MGHQVSFGGILVVGALAQITVRLGARQPLCVSGAMYGGVRGYAHIAPEF